MRRTVLVGLFLLLLVACSTDSKEPDGSAGACSMFEATVARAQADADVANDAEGVENLAHPYSPADVWNAARQIELERALHQAQVEADADSSFVPKADAFDRAVKALAPEDGTEARIEKQQALQDVVEVCAKES